ncbi:anaerobic ribonucleoside-triphosphate reductase activating protein [Lutibacter sp. A80]|uniref:anaerobic ribonucleoside-triphosphate reductase activating protein n=1 Tax=Lutibacter sp. A80 TaxID=2918453 RepID=UPI0035301D9F
MNFSSVQIVLQEVPGEISICFSICGCTLGCKGCHSPILWKASNGEPLTIDIFKKILAKYKGLASCVLFMGGEWHKNTLLNYLEYAKNVGYKTCLYTGNDNVDSKLLAHLNFIKTGKWIQELGGLDSPTTNQKFKEVQSNKLLNHLFQQKL